jgi:hypothetical protein
MLNGMSHQTDYMPARLVVSATSEQVYTATTANKLEPRALLVQGRDGNGGNSDLKSLIDRARAECLRLLDS